MKSLIFISCFLFSLSGYADAEPLKKQLDALKKENKSLLETRDSLVGKIANPTMVDEELFLVKNRLAEVNEELKQNKEKQLRIESELDKKEPNEWDVFNDF